MFEGGVMQKVLLTIRGSLMEGETDEAVEFVTEGTLQRSAEGFLLEYDESALTGVEGVTTRLMLEDGTVTLERSGAIDTHMVFSPGSVFQSSLGSPAGQANMSIFATRVESSLQEKSGSVKLEYEMSMGDLFTMNKLDLSFKNMEDRVN
jgi:uncharacterized beta-barrel protein YwiB (DUF1934 family)